MGVYEQFFVDPSTVFLVALTAFVAFTTSLFSRPYMRHERDRGRMTPGGCGSTTACTRSSRSRCCSRSPPTTSASSGSRWRQPRSRPCSWCPSIARRRAWRRLEVLHPLRRGHRAGASSARSSSTSRRARAGAEGSALLWTHLDGVKGQLEPAIMTLAFVFLLVGYGTKVGLVPAAQLAARRARRGPDADLPRCSRAAPQRRALQHHPLQGARRRRARVALRRAT
jgi:hydrogenase-4 component F